MTIVTLTGYSLEELAVRWHCSRETIWAIVHGVGGFVDRGFVEEVGDRLVVTELGVRMSHVVGAMHP